MRIDQIALQLYTVRRLLAEDLPGTLRAVVDAGYRAVEVAGVPAEAHDHLAPLLAEAGLAPVAAHVGIDRVRSSLSDVAEWLAAMECPRLIVPSLPQDERTVAGAHAFAIDLNDAARSLAGRGIRVGYHNHAFEFEPLENTSVWDVLLAELDPEIEIELDVYWASIGGREPAAEIERTAGRVRLLHLKDRSAGAEPHDAPAGEGILDLAGIVAAGRAAGVAWYIAEQDEPRDEIADITSAHHHLIALAEPA